MSAPPAPSFTAKIYGEIVAQIQVNGTTTNVSCSADPSPNYADLFQNHSACRSSENRATPCAGRRNGSYNSSGRRNGRDYSSIRFHTADPQFMVAWIIGGVCALVSLIICLQHLYLFSKMDRSNLRSAYTGVCMMAPVRLLAYLSDRKGARNSYLSRTRPARPVARRSRRHRGHGSWGTTRQSSRDGLWRDFSLSSALPCRCSPSRTIWPSSFPARRCSSSSFSTCMRRVLESLHELAKSSCARVETTAPRRMQQAAQAIGQLAEAAQTLSSGLGCLLKRGCVRERHRRRKRLPHSGRSCSIWPQVSNAHPSAIAHLPLVSVPRLLLGGVRTERGSRNPPCARQTGKRTWWLRSRS